MIRHAVLDNGTRLVTEAMPDSHSVTIGFWVDAGSRDEELRLAGASHFLEHLLFKGTATRSARQIAEGIEAVGGEMNAYTTKEYTTFYTRLLDADLELGLDILCDIMSAPAFRPDEIEAERQVILEEILMHEDEPSDVVHDLFSAALYGDHPLGREVLGSSKTITAMTRDDIVGYFSEFYRPSNMVIALAGHLDHDRVLDGLEQRLAPGPAPTGERQLAPMVAPVPLRVDHRSTEQAHIVLGMPGIPRSDDDRYALAVLNQVLGGGMSSRLFQEIREKRGLVYSVYSYRMGYRETGALAVYAGTAPGRAHEVLQLISDEFERLCRHGVSDHELTLAKGHIKGSLALSLEDSAGRMSRIGRSELVHGEVVGFEELAAFTDAVQLDDVRRVIDRVVTGPRVLAVVGPFEEASFAEQVA